MGLKGARGGTGWECGTGGDNRKGYPERGAEHGNLRRSPPGLTWMAEALESNLRKTVKASYKALLMAMLGASGAS